MYQTGVYSHVLHIKAFSNHNVHISVIKIILSHHTVQTIVFGAYKSIVNDGEIGPLPEIKIQSAKSEGVCD